MSMHWKALGTEGRIRAIKAAYQPGMSVRAIAAAIGDVSKGSVIGMFHRYGELLSECKLNPGPKMVKAKKRVATAKRVPRLFKAAAAPRFGLAAPHVAGMPLEMIKHGMCKFSVNAATWGETHLFCGTPGDGQWCGFHHRVVYRDPRTTGKDT